MPTIPCNNYVVPIFEIDECLGDKKPASCVIDSSAYTELGLESDATQQQINQAQYLASLNLKSITESLQTQVDVLEGSHPNGSETKIISGANITVTGTGTNLDNYIISSETPILERINEGNGNGITLKGRDATKYGNVGLDAIDLSYSTTNSSLYGATGRYSFASGDEVISSSYGSAALNCRTIASNDFAFASGYESKATGYMSTAMGNDTVASGNLSYAEGGNTNAAGGVSHAEGLNTEATGTCSHSQNQQTVASGVASDAGGLSTRAKGDYSFTTGLYSEANSLSESSIGMYGTNYVGDLTTRIDTDRIFNVGNGTSDLIRSDAVTVLKNGLATLPSVNNTLIVAASGKAIVTKEYLPTVAGDYANDADAALGGVLLGQMYHTTGIVKIRIL